MKYNKKEDYILDKLYKKRLTPLMGWASWNNYHVNISEDLLKKQIDAMVSTGLTDVGYTYFNIDDGFFGGRNENGYIKTHQIRFPNGMKVIADYVHERGLKAGIYSDGGDNTCAHVYDNIDNNRDGVGVGLYGYDEQDLRMYLMDWGYDFIKVDWCGGLRLGLDEQTRYTEIGNIINKIKEEKNSDVIYNVCRWEFPGEWVMDVADSWRISTDIGLDFLSILKQIDAVKPLAKYHGPGHVNDLDMLQVGRGLTYEEDKTHFAMWCMMSTPLMLGNDLTTISKQTLSIIKNTELIAINQDSACLQAIPIITQGDCEIWMKDLGEQNSNQKAIAILNRGGTPLEINVRWSDFGFIGLVEVRDVWEHANLNVGDVYRVMVPGHGTAVYKVSGDVKESTTKTKTRENIDILLNKNQEIDKDTARVKVERGAVLIDVRTIDEYNENHIDGAIHIPHTCILSDVHNHILDKNIEIIVYCSTRKRAIQAKSNLDYLGYPNVYVLNSMSGC